MAGSLAKLASRLKPSRRWAQFSLGTMLLAVTVLCVWLADYVSPVRRLERQLGDPDEYVRVRAAERLGYLGRDARSTSRSLVRATEDTSAQVRVTAVWALSRVAGRTDVLTSLLSDGDKNVAMAAAEGLLWMGEDPVAVVPLLLEGHVSIAIFEAMSPAQAAIVVPLFSDSLSAADPAQQQSADPAQVALNFVTVPATTVVPDLIERLDDERPYVRIAAAAQLSRLREKANRAAPALRARLQDPDAEVVLACAAALGAVEASDTEFLPILKRALRSKNVPAIQAASYLSAMGPAADRLAEDLVEFLVDFQRYNIWGILPGENALVTMGRPAVSALDGALRRALIERDQLPHKVLERVKIIANEALPEVRRARELVPGVATDASGVPLDPQRDSERIATIRFLEWMEQRLAALAEPKPDGRLAIPRYLAMIGPPAKSAVPTLVAALDYGDFQYPAIHALASIGQDAAPAADRVWLLVDSPDEDLRNAALRALQKMGVPDKSLRARLRPALRSQNPDEGVEEALLISEFGASADEILAVLAESATDLHSYLTEALQDDNPKVRRAAAEVAGRVGPAAKDAVVGMASNGPELSYLTAALQDDNPDVRRAAAEALGRIGPSAKDAVPRLIELLDDEDWCDAAAQALGHIGPAARAAVPKLLKSLQAIRQLPDSGEYEYFPDEYFARLDALAGIGSGARDAVPELLRLANFDDRAIRGGAVLTLGRIDPTHPSLVPRMRSLLLEWERSSAIGNIGNTRGPFGVRQDPFDNVADKIADTVWALGPHAEPLAPDLERIVTANHLVDLKLRCYAAFALARYEPYRQTAKAYLKSALRSGLPGAPNLADKLLQRIDGVPKSPAAR